jgi:hypothetical protein
MACDPDDEELQRQETPAATNSGLGLERGPATLRVKLRLAMPNGTELSDIDVLVDTGSEPDLVDSKFAQLLWQNGVRYGDAGGHLTVVGFWKAYLSIRQPLTAHDPIHPQVSSRHDP